MTPAVSPVRTDPAALAWELLAAVPDPELPTVSVVDLGIVRDVAADPERPGGLVVTITPTYSGCPAMREIEHDVAAALTAAGLAARVVTVLAPPWTTDWITPRGRALLLESGIAPPAGPTPPGGAAGPVDLGLPVRVEAGDPGSPAACPRCGSAALEELATFGSTACKALWRCTACREPFDYLKRH